MTVEPTLTQLVVSREQRLVPSLLIPKNPISYQSSTISTQTGQVN